MEETQRVTDVLLIRLLYVEIFEVEADVGAAFVLLPWWWVSSYAMHLRVDVRIVGVRNNGTGGAVDIWVGTAAGDKRNCVDGK